ncbi:hypothetical protein LOTGIDRAFT_163132 [Lottia gigantea]|uniref:RAD51 interacting motif domain-containing protein n=1 Tax=Lottia gigantea TaxID=225164 RepID=V3ZKC8_LOTGI|nr:hypothetical protein LOTGIDRAFT_163132 [Lottia gigantea]ESO91773.1 hypothetical protein LOTGIDRAFT_163132 [Lottia gigantea]
MYSGNHYKLFSKPPPEDRLLELQIKEALAASLKESGGNDNDKSVFNDVDDDNCFLVNDKLTSTQKDPEKDIKVKNDDEIEVISTTVSDSPLIYNDYFIVDTKVKNGDEIEVISSTTVSDSLLMYNDYYILDSKVKNGDEIEVISTTVSDSPPRKRQKTSKYNCIDSDSDNDKDSTYGAESDASDDDDFDPDNNNDDDDDNINKKSQVKKKNNQTKTVTNVSKTPVLKSTVKTPKVTKSVSKLKPKLPSTPKVTINTPGVASVASGTITPKSTQLSRTPGSLPRKIPSWTPPGPAGKHSGESIKSPGGIRIGLSRQQRVKTLHPSLTIQP